MVRQDGTTTKNAIANQDTEDKVNSPTSEFQRYLPSMDGKCRLGYLSSALVVHHLPGTMLMVKCMSLKAPEGDRLDSGQNVLDTWFPVLPSGHFQHEAGLEVDSEGFKRYFPASALGNRLRHHLLLGDINT